MDFQNNLNFIFYIGLFVLNLICHNPTLKESIMSRFEQLWNYGYMIKFNLNEILFYSNTNREKILRAEPFSNKNENFNKNLKGNSILMFEQVINNLKDLKRFLKRNFGFVSRLQARSKNVQFSSSSVPLSLRSAIKPVASCLCIHALHCIVLC